MTAKLVKMSYRVGWIVFMMTFNGSHAASTNTSSNVVESCVSIAKYSKEIRRTEASKCDQLSQSLGSLVSKPSSTFYQAFLNSYWSDTAQLSPTCVITPSNASDVSTIVKFISNASKKGTNCQFAVRSGGHAPLAGSNNINNGITIDLSALNQSRLSTDKTTLSVGPGAKWRDVYNYLMPYKLGVSGARVGSVGVGGLITGAGYSFFSSRYGFVCDTVQAFEVVTGTGEIKVANRSDNADLFEALKGGGNNLGIITRFDLMTFPQPSIWGGIKVIPESTIPQLVPAIVNFTNHMANDPYRSLITNWLFNSSVKSTFIVNVLAYTGNFTEEVPPAFDEINSLGPDIYNTLDETDMVNLTSQTEQSPGLRDAFVTLTLPNEENAIQKVINISESLTKTLSSYKGCTVFAGFEPLPAIVTNRSVAAGGNVLGLDRNRDNLILVLFDVSWSDPKDDAAFFNATESMVNQTQAYLENAGKYKDFLYYNYAGSKQNPIASYGDANIAKLKNVSKTYDPNQIFQKLVPGGFKLNWS